MKRLAFPFSAIVGQEAMKTALLLNAVDPRIGGVLIRGNKGTGKSSAARALRGLLPEIEAVADSPYNAEPAVAPGHAQVKVVRRPMPFIELPLNATEDRLVGTLHLERALTSGVRQFEPGLLAAANRGVLYVDEVNLLDDHLVDMLLDAAATGVNQVEREGISVVHPARFLLIGTMNPEEGELRPQFLDRFGLCVTAERVEDLPARAQIVRRHLDFEQDPEAFIQRSAAAEQALAGQIGQARRGLAAVVVPEELVDRTVRLADLLKVHGHRADITILKAARAHAALLEKAAVDWTDVAAAANLALAHRLAGSPLDTPGQINDQIRRALRAVEGGEDSGQSEPESAAEAAADDLERMAESLQIPGAHAAGSILFEFLKKKTLPPSMKPTNS
jgi:Mg-chelatase subunit ChlI